MPVTAKLSKAFYDRMGEEVANELVNWIYAVDATYRSDLRELNELNFARFDAKLEQRIAEVRAELRQEMGTLRTELQAGLAGVKGDLKAEIAASRASLMNWMFVYWAGSAVAVIGVLIALLKYSR